jgi:hypothetical protein
MNVLTAGLVSLALTGGLPEVDWLGDALPGGSARALGMGETGFMDPSPLGALVNPAALSIAGEGTGVEASGSAVFSMEKRTRKVYDSFGSTIGESEYSFVQDLSFLPGGVAVSLAGPGSGLPSTVAVAAGWTVPGSYCYSWHRTVRDDNYVKTGEQRLDVSGITSEFALSVAFMPTANVSVGIGGGYLTGSRKTEWEETFVDPTIPGELTSGTRDVSGLNLRGGVMVRLLPRLRLSVAAEKAVSFTLTDSLGEQDVSRPLMLRGGAEYVPGNSMHSIFTAEFYWRDDGSVTVDGLDAGLHTAWGFHAGVENHIPGGPDARVGFCYDGSPLSRALDRMTFTAGVGVDVSEWNLDVGAGFSPVSWRQTEVPGLVSFDPGDSLTVEESTTRIAVSLRRTF